MKRAVLATLTISLFAATAAMADSRHDRSDHDNRYSQRYEHDRGRYDRRDSRNDRRHYERRDWSNDRGRYDRRDWRNDRRHHDRHDWRNDRRYDHRYNHRYDGRRNWNSHYRSYRYHAGEYRRPWGYYHRSWYRGDRLPVAYYAAPYRIYGYRDYGLYGPPRGYYWVRVDNDALLAAVATGLIIDAVYDAFY